MESIRKWFCKPKRDDKSLLAQFYFADEALNIIASELDSFDGRKDPGRCTTLVNQMRQSQDKVLTITNAIMDVLIGDERANRDFRVKFPEDVLQENLAGQLWFGAECLAAGSSIMNKEAESTEMRPLAKAVTKSLENVRNLLRDTCLRNNIPNGPIKLDSNDLITEMLLESLKIFDKLFADFELAYVSAMVPVKTTHEYELQELISVLFSETLQRSLRMRLLTQDMIDDCDPALMFTIPRLSIVSGLLIYPGGPLFVDRPFDEMSTMYRPFRTLLHKIRELLWTLTKRELYILEKLLCDNEQIADFKSVNELSIDLELDQFIDQFYNDHHANEPLRSDSPRKSEPIRNAHTPEIDHISSTLSPASSSSGYLIPNSIAHDIIVASICAHSSSQLESPPDHDSLEIISEAAASLSSYLTTVKGEALGGRRRQIEVVVATRTTTADDSGVCTENTSLDRSPSLDCQCGAAGGARCACGGARGSPRRVWAASPGTSRRGGGGGVLVARKKCRMVEEDESSVGSSDTSSFNSNCGDDEEIALAMQAAQIANRNEIRAKYKSSADLLHRLYVCIAGVADQLQTNFASDLRNILKSVFQMNASDSSPPPTSITTSTTSLDASLEYRPTEDDVIEHNEFSVDPNILAQEALFDTNVYFHLDAAANGCADDYSNHPRHHHGHHEGEERTLAVDLSRYASLREDLAHLQLEEGEGHAHEDDGREEEEEEEEGPPVWIPDIEAPQCMSCAMTFTVVKRRHHCRNCGKVFCARCSANSVPLPKFGHHKPVRVCNRCFMYNLTPFTM